MYQAQPGSPLSYVAWSIARADGMAERPAGSDGIAVWLDRRIDCHGVVTANLELAGLESRRAGRVENDPPGTREEGPGVGRSRAVPERERIDDLLTRAVDLLDCLREQVGHIGTSEHVSAGGQLFDQIDATRSSAYRARRRLAF